MIDLEKYNTGGEDAEKARMRLVGSGNGTGVYIDQLFQGHRLPVPPLKEN